MQAACSKQTAVAKNFHENWGYLRARPEECKPRAFETRLVKYFSSGLFSHASPVCSAEKVKNNLLH
jgi:hypothetical protein